MTEKDLIGVLDSFVVGALLLLGMGIFLLGLFITNSKLLSILGLVDVVIVVSILEMFAYILNKRKQEVIK